MWDKTSGNAGFGYLDDEDSNAATAPERHQVWMLDAAASWNQMQMLRHLGVGSVALWRLGSEDPGFWDVLNAWRDPHGHVPDLGRIRQANNVDVEGNGEILRIVATPQEGSRQIQYTAAQQGRPALIDDERYGTLPTPYVVRRTGDRPKLVALTFDDGPDPKYTPEVLSVLERYHVPATFFIIGENGVAGRSLLQRMVADGDEIGNHSYTHPNMAEDSATGVKLELNATQRLIEAYTGRSTRLFRAPYFGDAEPTTSDELWPALIAQKEGYTVVGLHADPGDWMKRSADEIVARTVDAVEHATPDRSANVILLHDGGGNREQTVLALPRIIERLEADGYRFVPASTLAGLKRDDVMPQVKGWDLAAVRVDVAIFSFLALLLAALNWSFFFAIALGVIRALGLTGLALVPDRRKVPALAGGYQPLVSVIIPAYNEERVIESSIHRILASDYPHMEVIVADDGSKDRTSAIVEAAFGNHPQVRLMTMVNGGKASALNRALEVAKGEIVVALDADTQFEPQTIARLVRWFENGRVGAVAGNAKVGNRVNLVTRWQAVEYVTAQNIERRALTRFGAIMVVPGAVGAWRRAAARGPQRCRRLSGRHLGRGSGPHHRNSAQGLEGVLRRGRGRLDRSARNAGRAFQAALPLGFRHAAVPVEAPLGAVETQARRSFFCRHAAGLAVPDSLRADLADDRSGARRLDRRHCGQDHAARLGADADRRAAHGALLGRVHRDRPCLRLGRLPARRTRTPLPADPAAEPALCLSPADVRRGDPRSRRGAAGSRHRLGQAGADGPRIRRAGIRRAGAGWQPDHCRQRQDRRA